MPLTVLNVDDREASRYVRTRILCEAGFDVIEASTGAEALDLASRHHPQLVLLDVHLPDINGVEVCRLVKANAETALAQVLHISATAVTEPLQAMALDSGADAYLVEPVTPELLIASVRSLIRQWQKQDDLRLALQELQSTKQALAESESRYRIMGETLPYGVWLCDAEGKAQYTSQSFLDLLEMTMAEMRGFGWTHRLPPEDVQPMLKKWLHCVQTGTPWDDEHRVLGPDGKYHCVLTRGLPVRDSEGKITAWVGINLDIDHRKAAEAALGKSEERLHLALRAGGVGTYEWNMRTGELFVGEELQVQLGLALGTFGGTFDDFIKLVHPDDLPNVMRHTQAELSKGSTNISYEYRFIRPDGEIRWAEGHALVVYDSAGVPLKAVGMNRDITETRLAQEELRRRIEELDAIMEVAPVAIWVANDPECRNIVGNLTANTFYEAHPGENVSATTVGDVRRFFRDGRQLRPDELPMQEAVDRNIDVRNSELEVLLPSGRRMYILGHASPLRDCSGEVRGGVAAFLDISDWKRSEQELRSRTQDLARSNEDLQRFAYAASHDLQEPLRTIGSFSELLVRKHTPSDPETQQYVRFIQDAVIRMKSLIHDLLEYSRVSDGRQTPRRFIHAEAALGEALWSLQSTISDSTAVITYDPLPMVTGDQSMISRVFQNLVGNAIKYRRRDTPPTIHISVQRQQHEWVFSVADNGIGFDMQHAERIFGVFQRLHSHAEYSGTGIGLAIVWRIVERHGGRTWVESEPGRGSTFYFTLPMEADAVAVQSG